MFRSLQLLWFEHISHRIKSSLEYTYPDNILGTLGIHLQGHSGEGSMFPTATITASTDTFHSMNYCLKEKQNSHLYYFLMV